MLKSIRGQARGILKSLGSAAQSPTQTELEPQIAQMENDKRILYERFILGEIGADAYRADKTALDTELERMKNTQGIFAKEFEKKAAIAGLQQAAIDAIKARKLSRQIVDALIDRVKVYPRGRVEVVCTATM